MNRSRRKFLKSAGLGFLALGVPPSFVVRAARAQSEGGENVCVIIFQRGGIDGLNAVVPFKDPSYYALRPTIALAEPGAGEDRVIDLDGYFGLHPALAPLKSLYDRGRLAIIHAVGSPDNTRSHFDAQDSMELGTPGIKKTPDGWLNRYLCEKSTANAPFRGVAMSARTPRILAGAAPTLSLSSIEGFRLRNQSTATALRRLYGQLADPLLRRGGESLFAAAARLQGVAAKIPPGAASYPPGRLGNSLKQIARLIKGHVGLEIAFAEMDGWDTHVGEGGAVGVMANRLREFGQSLAAFEQDLGDRLEDVVIVTLSEFGRTAGENGNRGTDHGHGTVMFVAGGRVRGGKVYGRWPGLAPEVLYEGRDLDLTTDYRTVCSEILSRHLAQRDLSKIFPAFRPPTPLGLLA